MVSRRVLLIGSSGIAAGILFSLSSVVTLLTYVSAFPLLLVGLAFGVKLLLPAVLVACAVSTLLTNTGDGLLFALISALPAYCLVHGVLRWHAGEREAQWYPVLRTLSNILLAATALFAFTALMAGHANPGGMPVMLRQYLILDTKDMSPEMAGMMRYFMNDGMFLLFGFTGWLWLLILYAQAAIANSMLSARTHALRPSLALLPGSLPPMLLIAIVASATLMSLTSGNDHFVGSTAFVLLVMPYFLSGLALLHQMTHGWRWRGFWLILFYFVLFMSAFPAVFAVGAGFYTQLAEMLDKRRRMG